MAAVTSVVAVASLAVAAAGLAVSVQQGRAQRRAAREANRAQAEAQRQADARAAIQARQEQVEQLRQQQIMRAAAVAQSGAQGNLQGSATQGQLAGQQTVASSNESFVNQINMINQNISASLQQAANARFRAQQAGVRASQGNQLLNLGLQGYGATGANLFSAGGGSSIPTANQSGHAIP